jgi:outer membrane protein TolC
MKTASLLVMLFTLAASFSQAQEVDPADSPPRAQEITPAAPISQAQEISPEAPLTQAQASTSAGSRLPADKITLPQYLELVRDNHPFFTGQALAVEIERKQAESLLGAQDWALSASSTYSHLGEASAYEYDGAGRLDSLGLETGLGRSFWSTGGRLDFFLSSDYTKLYEVPGFPSGTADQGSFYQRFGASYSQPLLKNLGGRLDRLGFELGRYAVRLRTIQALESEEDFMLERAGQFLDWALLNEKVSLAEQRLALAREQLSQIERRYRANLVDRADLLRGEEAVRAAEQGLLKLQSLWKAGQAGLAVYAQDEDLYERTPALDLYSLGELPAAEESLASLEASSRVLSTFTVLKQQLVRQRQALVERKRAELNLTVSGGLAGRNEELPDSLTALHPDVSVALEFSATPANRTIKAEIEKVDAQVDQLLSEMREVEIGLEASLRSLLIQLSDLRKILELNRAQIAAAGARTEEELRLYNQGRGQLVFVLQSRDDEESSRLEYADNAALYQSLLLQYWGLMDKLWPPR